MPSITPCLWFDNNAEEAVTFWLEIFDDAEVTDVMRFGEAGPGPKGGVLSMNFTLQGQPFMVLNGGPMFKFSPATSFFIACDTQEQVDRYWDRLSEGGSIQQCGWLQDKFGVSWQVVPKLLGTLLQDPDKARSARVMQAMLTMKKLDSAALQQAYDRG